ncbi:ribosomal biogenesis protein LAS1L [Eucyclogobius newberryi]|uniref:ribosomal biogenesis protein LAS1L n=1 Tax=Eucyclogobius newberryi TaxID=166745 RepID=UPI003B5C7C17
MKRKSSSEKNRRHVVAWINKAEWDQVLEYLYSSDTSLQKHAVHRISAWKSRFAGSTPVAVECTADLVRCQVLDRGRKLDGHELVLLYGTALVRFVNLITERQQGRVARPLRRLAGNLNIPEWIVNLRHDFTHRKIPSLKWCRKGCKAVLDWLQQEYWSRQLSDGDWDAPSDGEDEDEFKDEAARQREIESYRKVRELLISYEKEQYQALEAGGRHGEEAWPEPFAEMSWILAEIKQAASESCVLLLDVLLEDGFLVPTSEQLETLSCVAADNETPRVPRAFLRFWLPLLRTLNSPAFVHLLLQKLFGELKLLTGDADNNRAYFVSAWIAEVVLCNGKKSDFHFETKAQRKARLKDGIYVNRIQLRWQQLLAACLDSPAASTPHLLKLILDDMEHPLPVETQHNLLTLCSIYTQRAEPPSLRRDQPVYTLESLREKLQQSKQRRKNAERSGAERKMSKSDADKVRLLRGSWWQLCTENVAWKNYALGKVPGQSDEPSCLMLDTFSTMDVPDQPVELDTPVHNAPKTSPALKSDGLLWTAGDVGRLKSGLKLF